MQRFRSPESLKRKIDSLVKQYGSERLTLDHGIGNYQYSHYTYEDASWKNKYKSSITIWYIDFDKNKTVKPYMTLTEDNMRKPNKNDWFVELVSCIWEKEYPTLLEIREYEVR